MTTVLSPIDHLTLTVRQETEVRAPIETTFAALLEQLGPGFDTPDGATMPLMLEAWPGGRWFRDLGNGDGHWWAVVQAIIQYRLTESNGGTLITFHHLALGLISDEHRKGVDRGWSHIHARVRSRAEGR